MPSPSCFEKTVLAALPPYLTYETLNIKEGVMPACLNMDHIPCHSTDNTPLTLSNVV